MTMSTKGLSRGAALGLALVMMHERLCPSNTRTIVVEGLARQSLMRGSPPGILVGQFTGFERGIYNGEGVIFFPA